MSFLSKFLKSSDEKSDVTSLNLETSAAPISKPASSVDRTPQARVAQPHLDPTFLAAAQSEVDRRTRKLLAEGKRPQALFLAVMNGAFVSLKTVDPTRTTLLIFTSGYTTVDYMRTMQLTGGVHMFPLESWPTYRDQFLRSGVDSIALDRCPRCPQFMTTNLESLASVDSFLLVWAASCASRQFQSQRLIRAYMDSKVVIGPAGDELAPLREKRGYLETLRDHIDYSVPFVHMLIAMEADSVGDETARNEATERMKDFGPECNVPRYSIAKEWREAAVKITMLLLGSYEMLSPDLQSAITVESQVEWGPDGPPSSRPHG